MFGLFKKKNKKKFVYLIVYYDFKTQKRYISHHFTNEKINEKYPKLIDGVFRNIELLFIFESDIEEED